MVGYAFVKRLSVLKRGNRKIKGMGEYIRPGSLQC